MYEVEFGVTTFRDLIYAPVYGGGIRDGHELKAFIPGGGSAPWFFEEHLDLPLEAGAVGKAGSMLGSGAIVVMDETTDMVKACLRLVRFFARESCGKCTPCREGTSWLERILERIVDGHGRPEDLDLLLDVCDNIAVGMAWPPRQTTICPLGPSATTPIASAVMRFRDEFEAYVGGPAQITVDGDRRSVRRSGAARGLRRRKRRSCRCLISDDRDVGAPSPSTAVEVEASQGRAGHRGRRAQRRLHPALLLPPAHEAGRHVPHVHRRGRHRPRPGAPAGVHARRSRPT